MAAMEIIQSNWNFNINWFATYTYVMGSSQFYRVTLGIKKKESCFCFKFYFGFHSPTPQSILILFAPICPCYCYHFSVLMPFFGYLTTYFISFVSCAISFFFLALKHLHVYSCGKYMSNVRLNVI